MWRLLSIVLFLGFPAWLAPQQHSYTPADIEAGARLYRTTCGGCHGIAGDAVPGVDFTRGQYKQARSDEDIVRVIRNGVANTSMPPSSFSEAQAGTIVAYLRSMAGTAVANNSNSAVPGDSGRGKVLLEGKGNCRSCHRINGIGGQAGPDLSGIAAGGRGRPQGRVLIERLSRAILDPNAELAAEYRSYRVVTRGGQIIAGTLLNQDTFSLQLRDVNDKLVSVAKTDLREFGFVNSPMPSYRDKLTAQEVADVVSYLASLKGQENR
jgi:putative heme-binding domain-containing protein